MTFVESGLCHGSDGFTAANASPRIRWPSSWTNARQVVQGFHASSVLKAMVHSPFLASAALEGPRETRTIFGSPHVGSLPQ
jgi:hypothetical protein